MTRWRASLGILVLLCLCVALFRVDHQRRLAATQGTPGFADGSWRVLSVYSLNFARYWYRGGAFASGFALHFEPYNPRVAEARNVYYSYPPGFLIPLYAAALGSGHEPDLGFVLRMSLRLHRLTCFLAGLLVFLSALRAGRAWLTSLQCAVASAALFYFLPAACHYYPATWWPDSLAPAAVLLLLLYELFARELAAKTLARTAAVTEALLFFALACVDWLPVLVVLFLGARRFRDGLRGRAFWPPLAGAAGVVFWQMGSVLSLGGMGDFLAKIASRTGYVPTLSEEKNYAGWQALLGEEFFPGAYWLFCATCAVTVILLIWWLLHRHRSNARDFFLCVSLPVVLHYFIVSQHYRGHSYNAVKWALMAAVLPAAGLLSRRRWLRGVSVVGFCTLACLVYVTRDEDFAFGGVEARDSELRVCRSLTERAQGNALFVTDDEDLYNRVFPLPQCYVTMFLARNEADFAEIRRRDQKDGVGDVPTWWFSRREPSAGWRKILGCGSRRVGEIFICRSDSPRRIPTSGAFASRESFFGSRGCARRSCGR